MVLCFFCYLFYKKKMNEKKTIHHKQKNGNLAYSDLFLQHESFILVWR